ncbi:transposase [uncultured Desulfatiglans sp.]|uniref:Transposase n=2 Tax=Desulfatiglans TaxID=1549126 RepID=A0A653ABJ6_UNCDX|nr:transposase [uncultured Desulfatiglans sp.]
MNNVQSLNHTAWDCKYHLVWIPKYRKKILYGELRKYLGDVLRELASHKESKIHEGHLRGDHVHMLISIPPKYAVSQIVGYLKGKSAIHVAHQYMGKQKNFTGLHFWARGYYVSTAGHDEEVIRQYIKRHEEIDKKLDQLGLFK